MDPDERARRFARASYAADDPTGWFERLYSAAGRGEAVVPWDRGAPHRHLVEWAAARRPDGTGRRALVVGCGLGDDAEYVASYGYATVAFDVSAAAIEAARERFAGSPVEYRTADLLALPAEWPRAFDLVVENMTVQALPDPPRRDAIVQVGRTVGPNGTLLVLAAGREPADPVHPPPWPLTRAEVDAFGADGLTPVRVEDLRDAATGSRRWRAEFIRPAP